jgi:hypothetical protein
VERGAVGGGVDVARESSKLQIYGIKRLSHVNSSGFCFDVIKGI